ncbi:MAG TPA: AMIN domain-containing protein, partial [Myxococcaceae bacterium]|nr:AMIN domain-containing protein [Myxococcaceae bacterium]
MSEFQEEGPEMRINVWMAVASIALAGGIASAAELNTLGKIEVRPTAKGAQVVVAGSRTPTFTVFRLGSPDRLVVDLSSADASRIKGHHPGQGPVAGIVTSQFSDERSSVGRVIVSLADASSYDVRADGSRLVISVDASARKPNPVAAADTAAAPATAAAVVPPAAQEKAPTPQSAAPAAADSRGNVVNATVDERQVKNPAQKILGLKLSRGELRVRTDGDVRKFEIIELSDPPRLALDVYGVGLSARAPKGGAGSVREIRVGEHADKVRVVIDMTGAMPRYEARRVRGGIALEIGSTAVARDTGAPSARPSSEPMAEIDGQKVDLGETDTVASAA